MENTAGACLNVLTNIGMNLTSVLLSACELSCAVKDDLKVVGAPSFISYCYWLNKVKDVKWLFSVNS